MKEIMEKTLIMYPVILMIILTLLLYTKNFLDNVRAVKNKDMSFSHFKVYKDEAPEYVEVSRQTLKNQFELPILFYFLISLILVFDVVSMINLIFIWIFVLSRYLHCYIRLTSNYVPHRAKVFQLGLFVLIACWIDFFYNIL